MSFEDRSPAKWDAYDYELAHTANHTRNYFTILDFSEAAIPIGNPIPYCFHLSWVRKDEVIILDNYRRFGFQTQCSMASEELKAMWNENDPQQGQDI